ncbi:MAG: hypothetical protein ACYCZO_07290 [Daejeonella sp.]
MKYITYNFTIMRNSYVIVALFVLTLLSGCELVGDIFKAGAYTGIFIVVVIIALIIWLLSKFRGRG